MHTCTFTRIRVRALVSTHPHTHTHARGKGCREVSVLDEGTIFQEKTENTA